MAFEATTCPRCRASRETWRGSDGAGFRATDGRRYCCEECAAGRMCTCVERLTAEVLLDDDVKGPAEEPSQMEHTGDAPLPPGQVGHDSGTTGTTPAPRVHEGPAPKRAP